MDKDNRCRLKSSIIPTNDKIIEFNNKESLSTSINYSGMSFVTTLHDQIHNLLSTVHYSPKNRLSNSR